MPEDMPTLGKSLKELGKEKESECWKIKQYFN